MIVFAGVYLFNTMDYFRSEYEVVHVTVTVKSLVAIPVHKKLLKKVLKTEVATWPP